MYIHKRILSIPTLWIRFGFFALSLRFFLSFVRSFPHFIVLRTILIFSIDFPRVQFNQNKFQIQIHIFEITANNNNTIFFGTGNLTFMKWQNKRMQYVIVSVQTMKPNRKWTVKYLFFYVETEKSLEFTVDNKMVWYIAEENETEREREREKSQRRTEKYAYNSVERRNPKNKVDRLQFTHTLMIANVCLLVHTRIWMWTFELRLFVCVDHMLVCPHQIRKYLLSNVSMTYRREEEKAMAFHIFLLCLCHKSFLIFFLRLQTMSFHCSAAYSDFKPTKWHHGIPFISFLFVCLFVFLSFFRWRMPVFLAHFTREIHTLSSRAIY